MQLIMALIAVILGLLICFGGWRFFLLLLPIWGFVVGFNIGTEATRALFGDGTFSTVTSWVIGFGFALVFAVLSYFYFYGAVALLAGAVGYILGAAAWGIIGNEHGFIAFIIGILLGTLFAVGALLLHVPRMLIIVLTALGGAATIVAAWFLLTGQVPADDITWARIGQLIAGSIIWLLVFAAIAAAGIVTQLRGPQIGTDQFELDSEKYRYS